MQELPNMPKVLGVRSTQPFTSQPHPLNKPISKPTMRSTNFPYGSYSEEELTRDYYFRTTFELDTMNKRQVRKYGLEILLFIILTTDKPYTAKIAYQSFSEKGKEISTEELNEVLKSEEYQDIIINFKQLTETHRDPIVAFYRNVSRPPKESEQEILKYSTSVILSLDFLEGGSKYGINVERYLDGFSDNDINLLQAKAHAKYMRKMGLL